MKLLHSIFLNSVILLSQSALVLAAPATSTQHRRQDAEDFWDQSWIRKWTAIGDSYSAGIGAGNRLDEECARYDESYPIFIQSDPDMGDSANREFTYLSCSGAVSKDMLDKQIPNVPDGQDVITISAGGNDVGLANILNHCVYQWASTLPLVACSNQLSETDGLLDSALPASLDALYAAAKAKLAPGGTVYVTGYARFWGNSAQCNDITWAFYQGAGFASLNPFPVYLTLGGREAMNRLVLKANQRIREAVERAGPQFVFVDYDQEYELMYGRFCEDGVVETSPNRENLLFYEWSTVDEKPDEPGRKRYDGEAPGTFGGQIEAWIDQTLSEHPGVPVDGPAAPALINIGIPPNRTEIPNTFNPTKTQTAAPHITQSIAKRDILGIIPIDGIKRVFHPRPLGHRVIAQLVLWHMANRRAQALNEPSDTEEIHLVNTCSNPDQPADVPQCSACSEGGGSELAGVCWGGDHDGSLCCHANPFICTQTGCNGMNGKCQGQYQGCPCKVADVPPPADGPPPICNGQDTSGWTCTWKCNGGPIPCIDWCNQNCNCMPNC